VAKLSRSQNEGIHEAGTYLPVQYDAGEKWVTAIYDPFGRAFIPKASSELIPHVKFTPAIQGQVRAKSDPWGRSSNFGSAVYSNMVLRFKFSNDTLEVSTSKYLPAKTIVDIYEREGDDYLINQSEGRIPVANVEVDGVQTVNPVTIAIPPYTDAVIAADKLRQDKIEAQKKEKEEAERREDQIILHNAK
jgi:hypothetical protein